MINTRLYRIAIVAASAIGAILVAVQNAGDLTETTVVTALTVSVINIVIIAIRQIGDPETPTFKRV